MIKDELLYVIQSIDLNNNWISLLPLYDSYGIKVDIDYYKNSKSFVNFKFKDLDKKFIFLSKEESEKKLQDYEKSDKILKVFFKYEKSKSVDQIVYYQQKNIIVENILPDNIDSSNYNFEIGDTSINSVKNKKENLRMLFKTEEIKDEYDSMPISLLIYYSFFKNLVNIIKIEKAEGLNNYPNLDINDYELIQISPNEQVLDYKSFSGGKRIKIIFQNFRLKRIYFVDSDDKLLELKAKEYIFNSNRLVKIISPIESGYNNFYGKIKKIPVYRLPDFKEKSTVMINEVSEDDYKTLYSKIPNCGICYGFIDVEVYFDSLNLFIYPPHLVSVPAEFLEFSSIEKEMELERIIQNENQKRNSKEIKTLLKIKEELITNYQSNIDNPEYLKSLSKEEKDQIISQINSYKIQIPEIATYIEHNELWINFEDISYIEELSNSIINLINNSNS